MLNFETFCLTVRDQRTKQVLRKSAFAPEGFNDLRSERIKLGGSLGIIGFSAFEKCFSFFHLFTITDIDDFTFGDRFHPFKDLPHHLVNDMLIVQDQVWNRVTVNRAERKSTRYFMDEFHLLLKEEQTAAYSVEIWKRFRKWGGIPTAITQNVKDLLASREVENIFENSDFVLMLNQAAGDRAILAKQLNISPQQMKYVTHTEAGEGLIFYGNVVLPFVDRFPKDTELYRVMTTKPEEVGEA